MSVEKGDIFFVMGVSGSGKSTIGQLLAQQLGLSFYDGDDFHPEANILKMSQGKPLDDKDRGPWLEKLRDLALEHKNTGCVIACSALKAKYRAVLAEDSLQDVHWVFLDGDFHTIVERLKKRTQHFMPEELLQSQFDTLEIPQEAIHVSIESEPQVQIAEIIRQLKSKRKSG